MKWIQWLKIHLRRNNNDEVTLKPCWFCGEQDGIEEIRDPNEEQFMGPAASKVLVCWECARYIEWAKELSFARMFEAVAKRHVELKTPVSAMPKPFEIWLEEKYGVKPKVDYGAFALQKKDDEKK